MIIKKSKTGIITAKAENKADSKFLMDWLIGPTVAAKIRADNEKKNEEGKEVKS